MNLTICQVLNSEKTKANIRELFNDILIQLNYEYNKSQD